MRVKRYRPNDAARLRLFCFPYAGGGLAVFRDWPPSLPHFVDVCSVELPGRERLIGEPPQRSLPSLVERIASAVESWLEPGYALYGHSMGALLAFELARYLIRNGAPPPAALLVGAHRAPQLSDRRAPLHGLPDARFIEELARLKGTPSDILASSELMEIYLPILRADFALSETYQYTPGPPQRYPILAFGGRDDPEVSEEEISAWCKQTAGRFRLRMLPGDHFFIHSSAAELLEAISKEMADLP
jgi:medium-chain acyl-[acyl-carrier-protein] hydrolase